MKKKTLEIASVCEEWKTDRTDYRDLSSQKAARLIFLLHLIRRFETQLLELQKNGELYGPLHTSIGQESVAVGLGEVLKPGDVMNGSHRAHHHFLAKTMNFYTGNQWNPLSEELPNRATVPLRSAIAEILGLEEGCCRGRGGSMHLIWPEAGFMGSNGIVCGGVPAATGFAFANRERKNDLISIALMGEGAVNQGAFHEALNFAALWNLPVVFVIENNMYAVGTHVHEASSVDHLAIRGIGYGIDSFLLDGDDPAFLCRSLTDIVESTRLSGKPKLVEIKTYRHLHHDSSLPGSAYGYRTKDEEKRWKETDPTVAFPQNVVNSGVLGDDQVQSLMDKAQNAVDSVLEELLLLRARRFEEASASNGIGVDLSSEVRCSDSNINLRRTENPLNADRELKRYVDVIAETLGRWLEADDNVFVLGEDVANFRQGPYGATKGLMKRFPGRVLNTPISENGFVGLAFGASLVGMKPVVEIMFPDFVLVAADQLFNQIAKARFMYGGACEAAVVVRTRVAIGTGMGPQHSLDPTGLFNCFSGWRIVAPANAEEYVGLFNTAMVSRDPVLIMEHHSLYREKMPVPLPDDRDYFIPFGVARIVESGEDVTIVSYGGMINRLLTMKDRMVRTGIAMELVDLRSIDYFSLDTDRILESLARTRRLVIVEESSLTQGVSAHIARKIITQAFEELSKPPLIITSPDVPVSSSMTYEQHCIVTDNEIFERIVSYTAD